MFSRQTPFGIRNTLRGTTILPHKNSACLEGHLVILDSKERGIFSERLLETVYVRIRQKLSMRVRVCDLCWFLELELLVVRNKNSLWLVATV